MTKAKEIELKLSGANGREVTHVSGITIIKRMIATIAIIGVISSSIVFIQLIQKLKF